jgi:hypothetical protein
MACVPERQSAPSQQPAQLNASQTHVPPEQRLPAEQGPPLPQRHTPSAQRSARTPQGVHEPPRVPHCAGWFSWHTPPWQHPLGQLLPSHTHVPPAHRAPAAQAPPAPHWQSPAAPHVSARTVSHVMQAPPAVPHAARLCARHACPSQQPPGQLVASQTQLPATQRCPAAHAGALPQRHCPFAHWSAPAPHATQAWPAAPQVSSDGVWHAPAPQQPVGQLDGAH